jgi:hypothetical protein
MIESLTSDPLCIRCNARMRFSCKETEKPGFVHDVFECPKCRSTQSYVTPEQPPELGESRRDTKDRRSGRDTRSEPEKQTVGERRSQIDRRSNHNTRASNQPSKEQLSLFAKRVRRAMRDEKSRHFFGVAAGKMILAAMPTSFDHLNGSTFWRVNDGPKGGDHLVQDHTQSKRPPALR